MAHWDEIFEDSNNDENEQRKKVCENRIKKVQAFLKNSRTRQWDVVSVEFGEQLFRDKNFNYHSMDKSYSIEEIKQMKGLNYGDYELCYFHHAVILTHFDFRKSSKIKTLTIIPIQTRYRPNSFKLEAKYHKFLEYDSYLLLDRISTIGIERISLTKSLNLGNTKQLVQVNPKSIVELKKEIKKLYQL